MALTIDNEALIGLNRLLEHFISSLMAPLGFDGSLNVDVMEFLRNLVVYPYIHFVLRNTASMISGEKGHHEHPSVTEITVSVLERVTTMARCDHSHGKYVACCDQKEAALVICYTGKQR